MIVVGIFLIVQLVVIISIIAMIVLGNYENMAAVGVFLGILVAIFGVVLLYFLVAYVIGGKLKIDELIKSKQESKKLEEANKQKEIMQEEEKEKKEFQDALNAEGSNYKKKHNKK